MYTTLQVEFIYLSEHVATYAMIIGPFMSNKWPIKLEA